MQTRVGRGRIGEARARWAVVVLVGVLGGLWRQRPDPIRRPTLTLAAPPRPVGLVAAAAAWPVRAEWSARLARGVWPVRGARVVWPVRVARVVRARRAALAGARRPERSRARCGSTWRARASRSATASSSRRLRCDGRLNERGGGEARNDNDEYGWMVPLASRLGLRSPGLTVEFVGASVWNGADDSPNIPAVIPSATPGKTSAIAGTDISAWLDEGSVDRGIPARRAELGAKGPLLRRGRGGARGQRSEPGGLGRGLQGTAGRAGAAAAERFELPERSPGRRHRAYARPERHRRAGSRVPAVVPGSGASAEGGCCPVRRETRAGPARRRVRRFQEQPRDDVDAQSALVRQWRVRSDRHRA